PRPDQVQAQEIIAYRAAVANGFNQTADSLLQKLTNSGFVVQLNDGGVMFVGNKTSAGMRDLEKELSQRVEAQISARNAARKAKDFEEADRIRDQLAAEGVILKDTKDGTTWEIAR
ncbi:MAG: cysteine--tRNA ligase, partial [Xanthobacteraceae bacterium]